MATHLRGTDTHHHCIAKQLLEETKRHGYALEVVNSLC